MQNDPNPGQSASDQRGTNPFVVLAAVLAVAMFIVMPAVAHLIYDAFPMASPKAFAAATAAGTTVVLLIAWAIYALIRWLLKRGK